MIEHPLFFYAIADYNSKRGILYVPTEATKGKKDEAQKT